MVADQNDLSGERSQRAQVGKDHLPCLVHDAHVRGVVALVGPQPAGGCRYHDAFPAAQLRRTCQVSGLRVKLERPSRVAGAKECDACASNRGAIDDVERPCARLVDSPALEAVEPTPRRERRAQRARPSTTSMPARTWTRWRSAS